MTREGRPARVLIVDDSASARRKLAFALRALGHETVEVPGGAEALARLAAEPFDLVLLDILMPGMDGFEVLTILREDARLAEIPVIVVSGFEEEPGAVIAAIRLGALDFLPKAFESVLLRARIGAALERKAARDRELVELEAVRRLTEAAELLERSLVSAERLDLGEIARRDDPLGRFATVFVRMAGGIHARERGLRRRLAARRGLALLIAAGVLFGLTTPLSKIAVTLSPHPMGLALWVNAVTASVCLGVVAWRGAWPSMDGATWRFVFLWGLCGASLAEVVLFSAAEHLPASTLSVIIVLETFLVFALSTLAGHERASARRLAGLVLGLLAVVLVMRTQQDGASATTLHWLLLVLIVPLCYAGEDLLIAFRMPAGIDPVAMVGLASFAGCVLLVPFVVGFGDAVPASDLAPAFAAVIAALVAASLVGTLLHARLIATAGAVFGSQTTYVITLAGIVWAMVLLGERLAPGIWAAVGVMFVGLLLVEPKREPDDVLDVGVFDRSGDGARAPLP